MIIGGGIAGTSAAEQLRKLDPESEITILSNEEHPLYSRVLLPHYISGKTPRERVFLKPDTWYSEKNIHLAFQTVTTLDVAKKQVVTTSGATYSYDKLLIAGGGITRRMPFDEKRHIYHFQTIEDADRIKDLVDHNEEGALKAGIIGGGFIAMEFAEMFARKNWNTHLFLRGDTFFTRSLDKEGSLLLEKHLQEHGITTHQNMTIASYDGEMAKTNENGAFTIDVLAAGIGINSSFTWASDAGIEVGTGVKTNEYLETNVADVFAAGDCTEYQDVVINRQVHIGNWMNAQMQGRHVAKVMTGERVPFELVSSYATHVLGIDIVAVGDAEIEAADEIIAREYEDGRTLLMIRDSQIVGASMINHNADRAPSTKLIKERVNIDAIKSQLADPRVELKTLV